MSWNIKLLEEFQPKLSAIGNPIDRAEFGFALFATRSIFVCAERYSTGQNLCWMIIERQREILYPSPIFQKWSAHMVARYN
jgi:hypothetical protein